MLNVAVVTMRTCPPGSSARAPAGPARTGAATGARAAATALAPRRRSVATTAGARTSGPAVARRRAAGPRATMRPVPRPVEPPERRRLAGADRRRAAGRPPPTTGPCGPTAAPSSCSAAPFATTPRAATGVEHLTYEAYDEAVVPRMAEIAAEARAAVADDRAAGAPPPHRPPRARRVVRLVVVSTPHRAEAFEAGRFAIDALKATVPIWKHETWRDGSAWGTGATPIAEAGTVV